MRENDTKVNDLPFLRWFFGKNYIYTFIIIAYLMVFSLIFISNLPPDINNFLQESISPQTLVADENVDYIDRIELESKKKELEVTLPHYYRFDEEHLKKFISNLISFLDFVEKVEPSLLDKEINRGKYNFSPEIINLILTKKNLISRYSNRIIYLYENFTKYFYILDRPLPVEVTNIVLLKGIEILQISTKNVKSYPVEVSELSKLVKNLMPDLNYMDLQLYSEIIYNLHFPNAIYDNNFREERIKSSLKSLLSKRKHIPVGEKIIARGEKIDEEKFKLISGYIEEKKKSLWIKMIVYFLISFSIYLMLIYWFYSFEKRHFYKKRDVFISFIFFIITNLFYFGGSMLHRELFYIPVFLLVPYAIVSTLLPTILLHQRSSTILLVSYTFFSLFYPFFDLINYFNFLLLSLVPIYLSKIIKKRSDFFILGVILSSIEFFFALIYIIYYNKFFVFNELSIIVFFSIGNPLISSIVSLGTLPFIEDIFRIPTHFKLLELSNASVSKLLNKLRTEAKGTYNHSILLGDICEAAAEAIGLNPLLVKVGAYYHDIGKIENPEYFIENQEGENKHNDIKISMSLTVIKSHVKRGIEIAEKNKIPEEIIDFIREHHGTTVISYFYHQAAGLYGDEKINIEDYKYPGPKPRTKETALLMLADATEATIRAYVQNTEKINPSTIKDIIDDIFEKRIQQGELDECTITFKELDTIKKEFLRFFSVYYHRRIEYGFTS